MTRPSQPFKRLLDMPDRRLDKLIEYIHNNRGRLSKRKRDKFEQLTDSEIEKTERAFQEIFEMP